MFLYLKKNQTQVCTFKEIIWVFIDTFLHLSNYFSNVKILSFFQNRKSKIIPFKIRKLELQVHFLHCLNETIF